MGYSKKDNGDTISLLEAIETLSAIADLEVDDNITIAETGEVVIGKRKAVDWINLQDEEETLSTIRDIFNLILRYIRSVYQNRKPKKDEKVIEGIKTIMLLVGEAAKKLDKYTDIFHWSHRHSITELIEYHKLQDFYQKKIARQVDTRQLSRWILGLSNQPKFKEKKPLKGYQITSDERQIVDLDTVKKDNSYELFFLRKDDGSRFFSPQLIKNITLICDFGNIISGSTQLEENSLSLRHWQDWRMRGAAIAIKEYIEPMLNRYYRETVKYKSHELVTTLNQAIMAIFLCTKAENELGEDVNRKTCFDYFADFLFFLRKALGSRDYQKMIAYPPKKENNLAHAQLDLMNAFTYAFFKLVEGENYVSKGLEELIEAAQKELSQEHIVERDASKKIWNWLACDYKAMSKYMRYYSAGPLAKILIAIQEGDYQFFDPIWQHNIPSKIYSLFRHDQRITNMRIPCPVHQENINKALINQEFITFIRSLANSPVKHRHLIINLQDRTSWKEYARCHAIERLQDVKEFSQYLSVVTLNKDSEFYLQKPPYESENHSAVFIETLNEHLLDESCGFYFPQQVKDVLTPKFLHELTDTIHRVFFADKNVLTRDERCDFIEVTYTLLIIKVLELTGADSFTIMCKDGMDVSSCSNVLLYVFLRLIQEGELSDDDMKKLNLMLYTPILTLRERVILPERFNRMISTLRLIENLQEEFGSKTFSEIIQESFSKFYDEQLSSLIIS